MIIILNGCPSAGKTSIIKEMQNLYQTPLLHMGVDLFWSMIPAQYKEHGSKAHEGYAFSKGYDHDNNPVIQMQKGPFAQKFEQTMPHVIHSLTDCGHDIAVDTIISDDMILHHYATVLKNHTVYFVGIVCDLEELEKRERLRGNRELGLARGRFNLIPKNKEWYDFTIDTTGLDVATCAQEIMNFIQQTPEPLGFKKLREMKKKQ